MIFDCLFKKQCIWRFKTLWNKMYNGSTKTNREGMEVSSSKVLLSEVEWYHLMVAYDNLKVNTMNTKATSRTTKWRFITNKESK